MYMKSAELCPQKDMRIRVGGKKENMFLAHKSRKTEPFPPSMSIQDISAIFLKKIIDCI